MVLRSLLGGDKRVFARFAKQAGTCTTAGILYLLFGCIAAPATAAPVTKDNLYGTSFVDARIGWACGAFGTIFHTSDAGKSWQTQTSGTYEALFSIDFVDRNSGWAVGRSGTIIHTKDGGKTWSAQSAGSDKHLFSVDFTDQNNGMAVGDWGVILVTSDGGASWSERSLSEDVILNAVSLIDAEKALVVGEIGSIFKTEDAGRSWTKAESGIDKTLFGVRCLNSVQCWAVGIDALILRTKDAGQSWAVLNGSIEMRALEQVGFGQAFENPSLYSVDISGEFGVAAGELGSVFVSRDGGSTWKRLEASKNWALPWFRDLDVVAGARGAIVGAGAHRVMIVNGKIEISTEGD